jgi:hypothetical protein
MKDISVTLLCLLAIIPHTLFCTELAPRSRKWTQKRRSTDTGGARVCSTIAILSCLESLSVHSGEDGLSTSPKKLQSLKLYGRGTVGKLPEWLTGLQNLEKLKLKRTRLTEVDGTKLPNLVILRLLDESFEAREPHHFSCRGEAFQSLTVLELDSPRIGPLEFPMAHSLFEGYHISRA